MIEFTKGAFPDDIKELLVQCDVWQEMLEQKMQSGACLKLGDLYARGKGGNEVQRSRFLASFADIEVAFRKKTGGIQGLYVFFEVDPNSQAPKARYVGITRDLKTRLKQHGWGESHNDASLAYLMHEHYGGESVTRKTTKTTDLERQQLATIRGFQVALMEITDDFSLYFFEVYLAGKWRTRWNKFRTH